MVSVRDANLDIILTKEHAKKLVYYVNPGVYQQEPVPNVMMDILFKMLLV